MVSQTTPWWVLHLGILCEHRRLTSQTHFTSETRAKIELVMDLQFVNVAPFDIVTQIQFPDIQCFINFREDPFYKEKVMPDHNVFTDPEKVQ